MWGGREDGNFQCSFSEFLNILFLKGLFACLEDI